MKTIVIAALIGSLAPAVLVHADGNDPPSPLPFEWAHARARAVSPRLAVANELREVAEARVGMDGDLPDPRVSARVWGLSPDFRAAPSMAMLMIDQELPLGDDRAPRIASQRLGIARASIESRMIAHAIELEVDDAFIAYWSAAARLDAETRMVRVTESAAEAIEARVAAGTRAARVVGARAAVARHRAEMDATAIELRAARDVLATLLDLDPETLPPAGAPELSWAPSYDAAISIAHERRPELALADNGAAEASALDAIASARELPTLGVGLGAMLEPYGHSNVMMGMMLEASITLPVFRGDRDARRREANALRGLVEAERAARLRVVRQEVVAALGALDAARAREQGLTGAVATLSRTRVEIAIRDYAADGDIDAVLDAIDALASLEREIVEARADTMRAHSMLVHATGLRSTTHDDERDGGSR